MTILKNIFPCTIAAHYGSSSFSTRDSKPAFALSANRRLTHLRMLQNLGNGLAHLFTLLKSFTSRLLPRRKRDVAAMLDLFEEATGTNEWVLMHGIDAQFYYGWPESPINIWVLNAAEAEVVHVSITDGNGVLIEEGMAELDEAQQYWVYTTQAINTALPGTFIIAECLSPSGNTSSFGTTLA